MAEGTPEAGTAGADGQAAEAAAEAQQGVNVDAGDFEARLQGDPSFYVSEFKKLQRQKDQAFSNLEKAKLAVQIAEALGEGDVEAGSQAALTQLQLHQKLMQDPNMSKVIEQYTATGKVPGARDLGEDMSDDDYMDPAVKSAIEGLSQQLTTLTQTVAGLSGQTTETSLKAHLDKYFESGNGRYLNPEERTQLFNTLEGQIRRWPAGKTLTERDVRLIATNFLEENDLVETIGERRHLQKLRNRGELATEGLSPVGPSAVEDMLSPEAFKDKSAEEALAYARNKFGG